MARQDARPITARPPWRQLYTLFRLAAVFVRLPYWTLTAVFSRPRNWTIKQAVINAFFRDAVDRQALAGVTTPKNLNPGAEGARFQVLDPAPASVYLGPALSPTVTPAQVGGTWYPAAPPAGAPLDAAAGPILLWMHGGAFVVGDSRDAFFGFPGATLSTPVHADTTTTTAAAAAAAVFSVEYRLSGYDAPGHRFPAALQDVLTAYVYLTATLRVPAARIAVGGDSAGANLAVAFLRYVEEYGAEAGGLERPAGGVVLVSPWVSPLDTLDPARASAFARGENFVSDYLPASFLRWGAATYLPEAAAAAAEAEAEVEVAAYITPLGHPFATRVPVFISFGEREVLRPGIEAFAAEMAGVEGNVVEVVREEDASHDTLVIGHVTGFRESAQRVAGKIGEFVRRNQTGEA